ncbi:hypothetical protein RYX36_015301, partial [Vicia faba]
SIEEVVAKKHILHVKAVKSSRTGQKIHRHRNSDGDDDELRRRWSINDIRSIPREC